MKKCILVWQVPVIEGEPYQAVLFAPEAKTRQWLYKKEVQNETMKKYYLEYMEYNSAQIEKVAEFLSE